LQPHSITLSDVTAAHGVTEVFARVSLAVGAGSRIGLVGPNGAGTTALASKVRRAERALERLECPEKPFEPWELRLELGPAGRSGELVVRLERAAVERGNFRLGPVDVELHRGDRLAVTGATEAASRLRSARSAACCRSSAAAA
jgi:hypothetical protein